MMMNDHYPAAPAASAPSARASLNIDWFAAAFWGVVIAAAILRFSDLAAKPLHHDESLYGVYCWRFFKGEGYRYDPMMHGPFMFHFQVLIFFLFGVGDFSVRMAPALLGTVMIAACYWLKDFIGKAGALTVAALLTLSPTHLYFSRFMRHDAYIACFTLLTVIFALLYARGRQPKLLSLTLASLALMFCVKENAYIHVFIFLTFLMLQDLMRVFVVEKTSTREQVKRLLWAVSIGLVGIPVAVLLAFQKIPIPQAALALMPAERWAVALLVAAHLLAAAWAVLYWLYQRDLRPADPQRAKAYAISLLIAVSLFAWVYIVFYSSVFTNRGGVVDGMAKSWTYWWNQHSIQRIKGPFHYYVPFIWQYELPAFLMALAGLLGTIADSLNKRIIAVWAAVFPLILVVLFGDKPLPAWFGPTHMEVWVDLVLTLWVLGIGGWAVAHFWLRREWLPAFFSYWAGLGFLIYAYAGEKVPWLFLHIVVPVVLLAGVLTQRFWQSSIWQNRRAKAPWLGWAAGVVVTLFGLYMVHFTVLLNYYNPANPVETMVYTQTSTDMLRVVELAEDLSFRLGPDAADEPIVGVQGNAVWPLAWYFRDYDRWYAPGDVTDTPRPLMVVDWEERATYREALGAEYDEIRVKLREWWIPKSGATLREWWKYLAYRIVFNPTGSSDVAVFVKRM